MMSWQAQELLDKILGKSIEIVSDDIHEADNDAEIDGGGVRLFKDAPVGIVFDHSGECLLLLAQHIHKYMNIRVL